MATELLGDTPICDHCWHLAGGAEAILARAQGAAAGPILEFDDRSDARLAQANPNDLLHPNDRLAVQSGVRWSTLRTIIPRDRLRLTAMIDQRAESVPACTTVPTGGETWLSLVIDRIAADLVEFKQPLGTKRRRWWRICRVYAICADRQGRPLTWAAHEVVAEAVGCSTKTVQRCLRWLERSGLLWEVVPGCVLRRCQVPDSETPAERDARQQREVLAEAKVTVDTAGRRLRIEAELGAVRVGHGGRTALAAADEMLVDQAGLPGDPLLDVDLDRVPSAGRRVPLWDKNPEQWVRITPVYELRVPLSPVERAEADRIAAAIVPPPTAGQLLAEQHRDRWVHPANAHLHGALVLIAHDGWYGRVDESCPDAWFTALDAVTSGNAAKLVRINSFVHPPQVSSLDEIKSRTGAVVDKRRASRGSWNEELGEIISATTETIETAELRSDAEGSKQQVKPLPEARRAAQWLLRSALDPVLCEEVDEAFEGVLAALIAGSGLLRHGWTWVDLRDEIHGLPEHPHLPRWVRDGRAWITAHVRAAEPHLPPTKRKVILEVERRSVWFSENRGRKTEAERVARRTAIDCCPLCDHNGLLDLGGDAPLTRCTHDLDSGGW